MKIFVRAKAGAKVEKVEAPQGKLWQDGGGNLEPQWYTVCVKERAQQGRANEAISKALAKHFKVSNSQIRLVSGATSKKKVFEIL